ncbi:OLC1v1033009C1 [Oldenlandia corymbosa var. corymbosa]|uniref:OLC1v1033009C1 n=1 Tax=Oldenlandia corymbosa var. corymbosa TaxID=529605 RepID=A0AAV1CQB4_OLDCO|nr:OLC1v1033009C1 [Oldenlandia corymbosa var. corymbosa]
MVRSLENGSSVAPFLVKCYEMVDDESTDSLISWSPTHSNSFIIWDVSRFSSELLPKYFKHSNLSSFIRQLNIYGFRKSDTDRWEFSNDDFVKGQKQLLKNIIRRKQTPAQEQKRPSQQKDQHAPKEDSMAALIKEVESLTIDRNVLMQELMTLRHRQKTSQSKLIRLREQLKGVEKHQQEMLSFIVLAMQNPGIFLQLLQPKENNWRAAEPGKKSFTRVVKSYEPVSSDGMIVPYQLPSNETSEPPSDPPVSDLEQPMDFEFSDEMKDSDEPVPQDGMIVPYQVPANEASEPSSNSAVSDLQQIVDFEFSDEIRDLLMNIDFSSGLMDEKLLSVGNHTPLALPDSLSDGDLMMDHFLLPSPRPEPEETKEGDYESTFHAQESDQNKRAESEDVMKEVDTSDNMDILGFLNS